MNKLPSEITFPNPGAGFQPIRMNRFTYSFVSGDEQSESLRVKYYLRESDKHIIAYAWFGPKAEGPPEHAHGGSIAAVLDEAMGATPWANRLSVVAAKITVEFKAMLPLGMITHIECWIDQVKGRKVWTKGLVTDNNGNIFSTGEGLYIIVPIEKFSNIPPEEVTGFGSAQPPFGSAQPPFGSAQPPFGSAQTPFGSAQPPFGSAQTPFGSAQTPFGSAQTPFGSAQTPELTNRHKPEPKKA